MAQQIQPGPGQPSVRMMAVDAKTFESVGYANAGRKLYVKFRDAPILCFEGVPGFRFQGLLTAARKDAYFKTYIKDQFLSKQVQPLSG
jgi:KTSC domain